MCPAAEPERQADREHAGAQPCSYLQDMLIKAQELTDISTTINNLTQQMLQDGTIFAGHDGPEQQGR